jgi:ribokinase
MTMKPILVVGSINLDLVAAAPRIPVVGETISGTQFQTFYGGKGANQAVAIGRLGHFVAMLGKVGTDAFGPQLRQALASAGVNADAVEAAPGSSGVALIATTNRGENSIIVIPGANGQVTAQYLDQHRQQIESAGIVLAQLEIPMPTIEHLAKLTKAAGVPLMLDPAPAVPLSAQLLRSVDWLTPNETETRILLNDAQAALDRDGVIRAAESLLALGTRNVVVKLGERGAFVAERNGNRVFVPTYNVSAVDSTAAGDAFNGAFAVGLVSGKSPEQSARYAAAVAAISVTRQGAQPSMPSAEEVDRFLASQP